MLVALGQWTTAEREFREALQLAEDRHDEYFARLVSHNLGTPAGIRGDFGEALRWLSRMMRTNGHSAPVPQEAIAHLNMARCYCTAENWKLARNTSAGRSIGASFLVSWLCAARFSRRTQSLSRTSRG